MGPEPERLEAGSAGDADERDNFQSQFVAVYCCGGGSFAKDVKQASRAIGIEYVREVFG